MRIALVLGGAECLWQDVEAALEMGEFQGVVACNDAGAAWPGDLDGWVSLHSGKLARWIRDREKNGHWPAWKVAGHLNETQRSPAVALYVDHRFPGQRKSGSSGLFAAKFALIDLGFDRAVCCGMPLEAQKHFFGGGPWYSYGGHRGGWTQALPVIRDRLRSMSGWTADLLGRPTPEWLQDP